MKICVYGVSDKERPCFEKARREMGLQVELHREDPSLASAHLAQGCTCVSILSIPAPAALLDAWQAMGVRFLSPRPVGMGRIGLAHARAIGRAVDNITYAPQTVADYTIMLILMAMRQMKRVHQKFVRRDFSFAGVYGRNLEGRTVGVVGCGAIGSMLIRHLSGFGCRILANDVYQNDAVRQYAEYVDLDTLYRESDIITIHTPLLPETTGMINREALAKMKDGVVLIDNARGELVDIDAIIEGVETEKIGALFMDAFPGETGIIHVPHNDDIIKTPGMPYFKLKYLRSFVNVYHTPHMAFFTEEAAESMARYDIDSIPELLPNGKTRPELPN